MMRRLLVPAVALLLPLGQPAPAAPPKARAAEQAAIFGAAGLKKTRHGWASGCDDSGSADAATIDQYRDINGDGRPEAVVVESSSACYGMTGQGFWLVSKQASGGWKLLYSETGVPTFLGTKGAGGYPDLEVGGPGFCFPVMRWNGTAYVKNRMAYEGKPCRR